MNVVESAANDSDPRVIELEDIVFHQDVVATGELYEDGILVGIPGEEPICTITPCANHRVKAPIGVGVHNGRLVMVSFHPRGDIHHMRGSSGDGKGLDVLAPIVEVMQLDNAMSMLAYGYRGAHITKTGFDEFTMNVEATPVLRAYTRSSPVGAVVTVCRGMKVHVTAPIMQGAEGNFKNIAWAITPSMMAASWKEELKIRQKRAAVN